MNTKSLGLAPIALCGVLQAAMGFANPIAQCTIDGVTASVFSCGGPESTSAVGGYSIGSTVTGGVEAESSSFDLSNEQAVSIMISGFLEVPGSGLGTLDITGSTSCDGGDGSGQNANLTVAGTVVGSCFGSAGQIINSQLAEPLGVPFAISLYAASLSVPTSSGGSSGGVTLYFTISAFTAGEGTLFPLPILDAAPEPASWTLGLTGLAMVVGLRMQARRRDRDRSPFFMSAGRLTPPSGRCYSHRC
jgi:hypothetical protein